LAAHRISKRSFIAFDDNRGMLGFAQIRK